MTALPLTIAMLRDRMPDTTSLADEPVPGGLLGGATEPVPSVNTPSPLPRPGSEERAEVGPSLARKRSALAEVDPPPASFPVSDVDGEGPSEHTAEVGAADIEVSERPDQWGLPYSEWADRAAIGGQSTKQRGG